MPQKKVLYRLFMYGYISSRKDEFKQFFEDNFVQLELKKGDALFFNPAIAQYVKSAKKVEMAEKF